MREILLLGVRRSGKTSLCRVVFGGMDPVQTQYLHATYAVTPTQVSAESLAKFSILDFPGQVDLVAKDIAGMQSQMRVCGALVFVLDCTDYSPSAGGGKRADYEEAISRLVLVVEQMHVVAEPSEVRIIDVFLHKADKLTSEHQRGVQEEVRQQLQFRLKGRLSAELESRRVIVQYHVTSIFDHSAFYAFSLVARRVVPNVLHIQSQMQVCCNNSHVLSYFLFGISRRLFIASSNVSDDRRPSERDVLEYESCSDIVDFFQSMHNFVEAHKPAGGVGVGGVGGVGGSAGGVGGVGGVGGGAGGVGGHHDANPGALITPGSPPPGPAFPADASDPGAVAAAHAAAQAAAAGGAGGAGAVEAGSTVDTTPSAIFRFPGARMQDAIKPVYLVRQLGPLLTLVVAIKPEHVDAVRPALEYNFSLLEKALMQILKVNEEIFQSS